MTARDLITAAMQEIGAIATGETVSAADAQAGLTRLNGMLDLWQTERLTIYNMNRATFSFVASQQTYTLGPTVGADWSYAVRPTFLPLAGILWTGGGVVTEIPLQILTDEQWSALRV